MSLFAPQFLAFTFVRRPSLAAVQPQHLLPDRRRIFRRHARPHPSIAPRQLRIAQQVARRLVSVSAIFSRRHLAFALHEAGEAGIASAKSG